MVSLHAPAAGLHRLIQWAANGHATSVEDMGVNHRCFHVLVPEQLLHRANVVAAFEQVGGKTVAEGMATDRFVDSCQPGSFFDGLLEVVPQPDG